jgi:hypothetical protein
MATALARRGVTVSDLEAGLAEAWSRETSADPTSWTEENAAWGQCTVTAILVQDYLGGTLRRGEVAKAAVVQWMRRQPQARRRLRAPERQVISAFHSRDELFWVAKRPVLKPRHLQAAMRPGMPLSLG